MKWIPPEEWAKLKAGIDCPLCHDSFADENQHSFKIIELKRSIVRFNKNQYMSGWTTLILKRHATELFEMDSDERSEFWDEVSSVAKALYEVYRPAKINYCIWGNIMPHIHCHLFTQTFSDDPSKPINQNEKAVLLSQKEYDRIISEIKRKVTLGPASR